MKENVMKIPSPQIHMKKLIIVSNLMMTYSVKSMARRKNGKMYTHTKTIITQGSD